MYASAVIAFTHLYTHDLDLWPRTFPCQSAPLPAERHSPWDACFSRAVHQGQHKIHFTARMRAYSTVFKVTGQRSRSCVYKCVNAIMAEAYISTVWRPGLLVVDLCLYCIFKFSPLPLDVELRFIKNKNPLKQTCFKVKRYASAGKRFRDLDLWTRDLENLIVLGPTWYVVYTVYTRFGNRARYLHNF